MNESDKMRKQRIEEMENMMVVDKDGNPIPLADIDLASLGYVPPDDEEDFED